ncbi:MAG: FMN-binding negative transcriptional regulator [Bacteroidetes bacterium]|nr:FMN-binding negative transcriptional regulator [Bacteroidota bacterium]
MTSKNGIPLATHLPFYISIREEKIILTSHFAKANNHWQDIENNSVLAIFSEPHAYISIHAYGEGKLITDTENTFKVLEMMIDNFEESYRKKWDHFPMDYKLKMSKGIVAFEIGINDLQGKKKLSQNRTDIEKLNIIESLSDSEDSSARFIASYMRKESEK